MKAYLNLQTSAALWVNFEPFISRQRPKGFYFFNNCIFANTNWIADYCIFIQNYAKMWTYYSFTARRLVRGFYVWLDVAMTLLVCSLQRCYHWKHDCLAVLSAGWALCCLSKAAAAGSWGQPLTSLALHETFPCCYFSSWEVPVQVQGW